MIRRLTALILCLLPLAASGASANEPSHLTLLTFNIRFGTANDGPNRWEARREMVMDVIDRHDAGVIGLQEALAFQIAEIRERFPHYAVVGVGRDDGRAAGEWSPILYRHDRFAVAEAGTFWLSDTPEETASATWGNSITRICTWARLVEHDTGRGVYVYNTHFDHVSQPSRERSARLIAERIASRRVDDPVVVTGDFNAGEANPAIAFLTADPDGPGLVNAFRVLHPDATEVGTFNGFRDRRDGEMIDFVLVEPGTRVLAAEIDRTRVDDRSPSDHEPVAATVVLRPSGVRDDAD